MKIKMYRPLNSVIVSLETELGERYFLIDSGCPISFAVKAKTIIAGAWFLNEEVQLSGAPFSLGPLSERLGVPLEGFIGLRDLIRHWRIYFDFDHNEILLGEATRHIIHDPEEATVIPMEMIMGAPIGIQAYKNEDQDKKSAFYIDTGSRFIILAETPTTADLQPRYEVDLLTFQGVQAISVKQLSSFNVTCQSGDYSSKRLCSAQMDAPGIPNVVGTEWLSQHNVFISFEDRKLLLWPRSNPSSEAWERLNEDLYGPQVEFIFDPNEYDKMNRSFSIMRRANYPLPEGLSPMVKYRLKDYVIPVGLEGINRFTTQVFSTDNAFETELEFIDENHREVWVSIKRLFDY